MALTDGKKSLKDKAKMRPKWSTVKIHVKGSLMAKLTPSQAPPSLSSLWPPEDTIIRYCAISLSSGVRNHVPVLCGKLGIPQNATIAMATLIMPVIFVNQ
jgi:hypothetical protein